VVRISNYFELYFEFFMLFTMLMRGRGWFVRLVALQEVGKNGYSVPFSLHQNIYRIGGCITKRVRIAFKNL